jgi:biotin synthase
MTVDTELTRLLDRAMSGQAPDKTECTRLLAYPERSLEAGVLMAAADVISRRRFGNRAVLLAQIGLETAPCPGDCQFCAFGESHTVLPQSALPMDEIVRRAGDFTRDGDLYALFLMTMHTFDPTRLLVTVARLRRELPRQTRIVLNIGDFDAGLAREFKAAGVSGAYHILRLREGADTRLDPAQRRRTLAAIRGAGLDLYYGCEPVGPEHTPAELAEQLFIGVEFGCFQHCAMRRVYLPTSPLARRGQINERRLAQLAAVLTLATLECPETRNIAVHEPNLLGLCAGANAIYAETGANPRDTVADTAAGRGLDLAACRKMLYEAGFAALLKSDDTAVPLSHATGQ